jgi:hypothetical protein
MPRIRSGLSFANVVSLIALFVALGGTGYAAISLPKNSVTAKQIKKSAVTNAKIKNNAVTSGKVKNGSLLAGDFKAGQVPAGARGPAGAAGAAGPTGPAGVDGTNGTNGTNGADGTAKAFARIDELGNLVGGASQAKGIELTMIQHDAGAPAAESTGPGIYCLGGLGFTPTAASVSLDNTDSLPAVPAVQGGALNFVPSVAIFKGEDLGRCNAAHGQVRVAIQRIDQTNPPELVNHGFHIWLEG